MTSRGKQQHRYVVGIDLGTTNTVVAYSDTSAETPDRPTILPVPQLIGQGAVESQPRLPSFLYLPPSGEFTSKSARLPWGGRTDLIVGSMAQKRGAEVPGRLVSSAKSWLSQQDTDREAAILPWESADDVARMSPLQASTQYLRYVRDAWDAAFPDAPLQEQDVLVTVPASFDAVARELTARAATDAGLANVTNLEEPQAAFYAWIDSHGEEWRKEVRVGDVILVCDIGGGTTDFSLIEVRESDGELLLERVAVGEHILLGGDNMDLALAYNVRERLSSAGTGLDTWQFRALSQSCREAKEELLGEGAAAAFPLAILGRGRKVVGGAVRVEVGRDDVGRLLVDGFFPPCGLNERPLQQPSTALKEIGLHYAADPGVTRHLAAFLQRYAEAPRPHRDAPGGLPTAVLFNGGVMRADKLRQRLLQVLRSWLSTTDDEPLRVLSGDDPEHAVARGAAYYGLARRGRGVRIRGGTARTYYIGIETAMPAVPGVRPPIKALCVVPRGLEEGSEVELPEREFGLVVGEASEFRFLSSASRREDEVGTLVEAWGDDIEELPPLRVRLEGAGLEGPVPVRLQARVSEVGVLELWCVARDTEQRWKLQFNVRGGEAE